MQHKPISDAEFDSIVSSWYRAGSWDKLKALRRIEALFKNQKQRISNAEKLERINNLTKLG